MHDDAGALQVVDDGMWVGSSVTLSDLMDKIRTLVKSQPAHEMSTCTALLNQLKYFAGNQIRNTASVGGNIVTGSPISDTCPLYMACGATFVLQGQGIPERQVLAEDFFLGYRSVRLCHRVCVLETLRKGSAALQNPSYVAMPGRAM